MVRGIKGSGRERLEWGVVREGKRREGKEGMRGRRQRKNVRWIKMDFYLSCSELIFSYYFQWI